MTKMKKILICALAVLMLLSLTACSKTCEECGKKIDGKGVEIDDKYYCDSECALEAGLDAAADAIKDALK